MSRSHVTDIDHINQSDTELRSDNPRLSVSTLSRRDQALSGCFQVDPGPSFFSWVLLWLYSALLRHDGGTGVAPHYILRSKQRRKCVRDGNRQCSVSIEMSFLFIMMYRLHSIQTRNRPNANPKPIYQLPDDGRLKGCASVFLVGSATVEARPSLLTARIHPG